jgi:predicted kinase
MEMILFIGIPGSGKSTFYKEKFFNSHLRISLDLLRTRNRERKLLDYCFITSMPFVLDNTNVSSNDRKSYIDLAKGNKYRIKGYYFRSEIKDCIERNELRTEKERVPLVGLYSKRKELQFPSLIEGFDELFYVEILNNEFVVKIWQDEV